MSKDHSGLVSVARALWGLQSVYGDIPNTLAQGRSVRKLLNMVAMFNHQFGQPPTKQVSSNYQIFRDSVADPLHLDPRNRTSD
jgi:hypothetical protein